MAAQTENDVLKEQLQAQLCSRELQARLEQEIEVSRMSMESLSGERATSVMLMEQLAQKEEELERYTGDSTGCDSHD